MSAAAGPCAPPRSQIICGPSCARSSAFPENVQSKWVEKALSAPPNRGAVYINIVCSATIKVRSCHLDWRAAIVALAIARPAGIRAAALQS